MSAGPASALLGFFMLDRIPEASRGSAGHAELASAGGAPLPCSPPR
ncbi:MAG: hypothetical protein ACLSVD_18510 [Eggerthellaceae bacterium]